MVNGTIDGRLGALGRELAGWVYMVLPGMNRQDGRGGRRQDGRDAGETKWLRSEGGRGGRVVEEAGGRMVEEAGGRMVEEAGWAERRLGFVSAHLSGYI
jgi:hypothetical protein